MNRKARPWATHFNQSTNKVPYGILPLTPHRKRHQTSQSRKPDILKILQVNYVLIASTNSVLLPKLLSGSFHHPFLSHGTLARKTFYTKKTIVDMQTQREYGINMQDEADQRIVENDFIQLISFVGE